MKKKIGYYFIGLFCFLSLLGFSKGKKMDKIVDNEYKYEYVYDTYKDDDSSFFTISYSSLDKPIVKIHLIDKQTNEDYIGVNVIISTVDNDSIIYISDYFGMIEAPITKNIKKITFNYVGIMPVVIDSLFLSSTQSNVINVYLDMVAHSSGYFKLKCRNEHSLNEIKKMSNYFSLFNSPDLYFGYKKDRDNCDCKVNFFEPHFEFDTTNNKYKYLEPK